MTPTGTKAVTIKVTNWHKGRDHKGHQLAQGRDHKGHQLARSRDHKGHQLAQGRDHH